MSDQETPAAIEDPQAVDKNDTNPGADPDARTPQTVREEDHAGVDKDLQSALSAGKKLHAIASGETIEGDLRLTDDEFEALGVLGAHVYPPEFREVVSAYGKLAYEHEEGAEFDHDRNYIGPMRRSIVHAVRSLEAKQ